VGASASSARYCGRVQAALLTCGRSLRVDKENDISGLNDNLSFWAPSPITASTHSRSVVKLPQLFVWLDDGARHSKCAQMRKRPVSRHRAPRTAFDCLRLVSVSCVVRLAHKILVRPKSCSMARTAYPNLTFSDSIRLWAVPYRRVSLIPSCSQICLISQLAPVVRHDFAHPFLIFTLGGSFEYLEGFWCVRLMGACIPPDCNR